MNARQKAKRLKKELEVYKKLTHKPTFITPHIETVRMKKRLNMNMYPADFRDTIMEETMKHIGEEVGEYLYEHGWINMRTDFDDMLNAETITAWIKVVVDNYDY